MNRILECWNTKSRHSGENRSPDVVPRVNRGSHLNTGSRFPSGTLDSGFRRNDENGTKGTFYGTINDGKMVFEFTHYSTIPSFHYSIPVFTSLLPIGFSTRCWPD